MSPSASPLLFVLACWPRAKPRASEECFLCSKVSRSKISRLKPLPSLSFPPVKQWVILPTDLLSHLVSLAKKATATLCVLIKEPGFFLVLFVLFSFSFLWRRDAQEAGLLEDIIGVKNVKGSLSVMDNGVRVSDMATLGKLRPAFIKPNGTVTAANASFLTDGFFLFFRSLVFLSHLSLQVLLLVSSLPRATLKSWVSHPRHTCVSFSSSLKIRSISCYWALPTSLPSFWTLPSSHSMTSTYGSFMRLSLARFWPISRLSTLTSFARRT